MAALALVLATTRLNRTSQELGGAVESVRVSHDVGIDLLLHAHTQDDLARTSTAASLRDRLDRLRGYVSSPREQRLLDAALASVEAYLSRGDREAHAAAYESVIALIDINTVQARRAVDRAAGLNRTAHALGIGMIALLLVGVAAVPWWLQRRVVRPMSELATTMATFGGGRREVRAAVAGPSEVVTIAEQFNAMAESLEHQRRSQTAVLGGVAHDLRSPLAAMRLSVATLHGGTLSAERTEAIAARLDRLVGRVERMVDDLLDATRIEAGQLRLELRPCDVREVIDEVIEHARASASGRDVAVLVPDAPIVVRGDALRLEQALGNLVSNAIKYSPEGGAVEVRAACEQDEVVVEVRDRGRGISEEDRSSLFQPFRRAGSAAGIAGVGLGLFVTRGIAEAHGGRVDVESEVGRGTVVRMRLPALRVAAP